MPTSKPEWTVPLSLIAGPPPTVQGGAAYRRPPFFHTKQVALLGSTPSLAYAPWHDPQWTLVGHPCCRPKCQREPDWYFDLHRPECFRVETKGWNPQYHSWLQRLQTPIFMQQEWPEIPMAVKYPLELVEAQYASSVTGELFATNHCAYMIALAMMEGVEAIGLFGCQYAGPERGTQRESLIYWIARFEQYGGRLVVPRKHNTIMVRKLYGYESHDDKGKLIEEYRPILAVEKKPGEVRTLHPVSEVPLAPLPEGATPRRFEDAFPGAVGGPRSVRPPRARLDGSRPAGALDPAGVRDSVQNPAPELVEA